MKRIMVLASLSLVLADTGCGGHKQKVATVPKLDVPGWYTEPPRDNDRLIGVATATSPEFRPR